ncbi:MAG: DUF1508 domain-containing protein [Candidatus Desantisbacteria bacterium]
MYKLQIYKDKKKELRWRLIARNGKIVCDSGEGYKKMTSLTRIVTKLFHDKIASGEIVVTK